MIVLLLDCKSIEGQDHILLYLEDPRWCQKINWCSVTYLLHELKTHEHLPYFQRD